MHSEKFAMFCQALSILLPNMAKQVGGDTSSYLAAIWQPTSFATLLPGLAR